MVHGVEYNPYNDWTDEGGDYTSVSKFGGFYVARFEAGVPSNAPFYASKDGDKYYYDGNGKSTASYIPVSKKGNQGWNWITQPKAKTASSNMYPTSSAVTSQLIDSYAWDTIIEWMAKYNSGIVNNFTRGNLSSNTSITADCLYALHRVKSVKSGVTGFYGGYSYATIYKKGQITSGQTSITTSNYADYEWSINNSYDFEHYNYRVWKELATGVSDVTKINNIYDMLGNFSEFTTEEGRHGGTTTRYVSRRGSSFDTYASICCRHSNITINGTAVNFGFRVVLYIK